MPTVHADIGTKGPLQGLRVIELAGIAPGPFAATLLADMGAEILCIERPGTIHSAAPAARLLQRNRRTVALDLKSPAAVQALQTLAAQADAWIEGFRPGVMERLGLGPDRLLARNPKLVYGRMTGWGQDGPLAHAAGHDANYIALAGALHPIGSPDRPPSIPLNLVGDFGGGGMFLAFGIVCALLEARTSGKGQVVDAAMVDGVAALTMYLHAKRASGQWADARGHNVLDGAAPWYQVYTTADEQYVTVAAAEPQFYAELLRLLGLDGDALPAQHDRARWPVLQERFAAVFRGRTRAEWSALLEGSDACFAPVLSLAEAPHHPHLRARGSFVEVDGVVQPAPAPRFSRTPAASPRSGVPSGADDMAVLKAWGLDEATCAALAAPNQPSMRSSRAE
jgi:alpha-methylacyl-CoA racemase